MDEKFLKNVELAVGFHRSLIKRAKWWGMVSTLLTIVLFAAGYLLDLFGETTFYASLAALIIPSIAWGWAWKEIYDFQKRIDAVEFFKYRYIGPPPSDDEEKAKIKESFEKIIDKNY